MADLETHYVECTCKHATHTLRFTLDPDDGELYVEVQLRQYRRWHERLWMAVMYVFGHQSRYGYYDCTVLDVASYDRLHCLLSRSEEIRKAYDTRLKVLASLSMPVK